MGMLFKFISRGWPIHGLHSKQTIRRTGSFFGWFLKPDIKLSHRNCLILGHMIVVGHKHWLEKCDPQ